MTSSEGSGIGAFEKITLKADDIKLAGKVRAVNIDVTTNKGLDMQNAENVLKNMDVKSTGNKKINGSVLVTGNSDEFSAQIDNDVTGDVTITNSNENGSIVLFGYGLKEGRTLNIGGTLTFDVGGDFKSERKGYFVDKDINIISRNGNVSMITLFKKDEILKAMKNITLKAAKDIGIGGQITAGSGKIVIDSQNGGIDISGNGQLLAGKNIDLTVGEGDIGINGEVTSSRGNVNITIDKSNLTVENSVTAQNGTLNRKTKEIKYGEINIKIGEGNIQIGNDTTKKNNETVLETQRRTN